MLRIKRISEAFSSQPLDKHVSSDWELTQRIPHIKSIEYIQEEIAANYWVGFYVGFNFEGQEVFKWVASGCNVDYYE